jgi:hypothetical protein
LVYSFSVNVVEVHVPRAVRDNNYTIVDIAYSYVLLKVDTNLTVYSEGAIVDLGIALNSLVGTNILTAGYSDPPPSGQPSGYLYSSVGTLFSFGYEQNGNVNYVPGTDTNLSNSPRMRTGCLSRSYGSPYYIESDNEKIQIGVMTHYQRYYSNPTLPVGTFGLRVTPQVYNFVYNNDNL